MTQRTIKTSYFVILANSKTYSTKIEIITIPSKIVESVILQDLLNKILHKKIGVVLCKNLYHQFLQYLKDFSGVFKLLHKF